MSAKEATILDALVAEIKRQAKSEDWQAPYADVKSKREAMLDGYFDLEHIAKMIDFALEE